MQLCAIPGNSTNDQPLPGTAGLRWTEVDCVVFCKNVNPPDEGVDSQVKII